MKASRLAIGERYYNPHVDGWLVAGKLHGRKTPAPYAAAWISRHDPETLRDVERFMDSGSMKERVRRIRSVSLFPDDPFFEEDHQKKTLYAWEDEHVCPHAKVLAQEEARALVRKVSRDYGMKPPALVFEKLTYNSEYDEGTHTIHFGHRDNIVLLHELAHAIYEKTRASEEQFTVDHCPAYVSVLIELYGRYAGTGREDLGVSAAQRGLLGDTSEKPFHFTSGVFHNGSRSHDKKPQPR